MSLTRSRTDGAGRRFDWLSVTFVLGGLLLCYYVVPLLALLFSQPPSVIIGQLTDPAVVSAATTSLTGASISTTFGALFGLPLAYWLARVRGRLQTLVTAFVVLPLVLPPIVSGMVLLTVVGPNTALGSLAAENGFPLTGSLAGVVLAQSFVSSPFVVVTAKAAFEGVDRHLEDASRSLGESRLGTLRRVTFPLAWPGIVAGVTLAFARSLGEFGATMMLAYYPRTMPVQIWTSFTTQGLETAFAVAVVLIGIAVATLVVLTALGTNPLE
ncbi:ABC transporter permease [Haloarcula nitratireducens]|uniref:ABC transporter permease n=1 Tax=Haloarcula nitratireducens TaxID=2487749 RepID=A0AAW4PIU1_9EURY|nr:ABC transporter permease [Halomicroarcula nitratireducens]MBX0297468.1 ABC transporter permease [Halomicroarcula nitratireducens]